ncbi:MAG: hypothetical protein PF488_02000 [Patescibacteria group bacterium]|jgi:hypothetical protein|nr:hypothetical protein [Patescibacteria group bacterium]
MKEKVRVISGVLLVILFIVVGMVSIRAGIGGMSNITAIMLATVSFVAAMIAGATTHYEIIKNNVVVEVTNSHLIIASKSKAA